MIYASFITTENLIAAIREQELNVLTDDDSRFISSCVKTAFIQLQSKLNARYDMALVFPPIPKWSAINFTTGQYCYHNGIIYKALEDTNENPVGSLKWQEEDPRNGLLVNYCVDIALYYLHRRTNRQRVPEDVYDRYHEAIDWLESVRDGVENPDLPELSNGTGTIPYGSNEQIDHYW